MKVKHFYKKLLSILLAVCLSISIAPISALAEGAGAVCKIGDDEYANLDLALEKIGTGERKTIELLADIYYDKIQWRHSDFTNVLFYDGHVGQQKKYSDGRSGYNVGDKKAFFAFEG